MKREIRRFISAMLAVVLIFAVIPQRTVIVNADEETVETLPNYEEGNVIEEGAGASLEAGERESAIIENSSSPEVMGTENVEEMAEEESVDGEQLLNALDDEPQTTTEDTTDNTTVAIICSLDDTLEDFCVVHDTDETHENCYYVDKETGARAELDEDGKPLRTPAIVGTEISDITIKKPKKYQTSKFGQVYMQSNEIICEFEVVHDFTLNLADDLQVSFDNNEAYNISRVEPEKDFATVENKTQSRAVTDHIKYKLTFDYSDLEKSELIKYSNISMHISAKNMNGETVSKDQNIIEEESIFVEEPNEISYKLMEEPEKSENKFDWFGLASILHLGKTSYKGNEFTFKVTDALGFDNLTVEYDEDELACVKNSADNTLVFTVMIPIKEGQFEVTLKNELDVEKTLKFGTCGVNVFDFAEPVVTADTEKNPKGTENINVSDVRFFNVSHVDTDNKITFKYTVKDESIIDVSAITIKQKEKEYDNRLTMRLDPKGTFIDWLVGQICRGYKEYDVYVTIPDGEYNNDYYLSVVDAGNHEVTMDLFEFTEEKFVVDTKKPALKVSTTKEDGEAYENGTPTNQKLSVDVTVENTVSGLEKMEVQFVPSGSEPDDTKWNTVISYTYNEDDLAKAKNEQHYAEDFGVSIKKLMDYNTGRTVTYELNTSGADVKVISEESQKDFAEIKNSVTRGTYYIKVSTFALNESDSNVELNQVQRNLPVADLFANKKFAETGWYNVSTGKPVMSTSLSVDEELEKTFTKNFVRERSMPASAQQNTITMYLDVQYSHDSVFGNEKSMCEPISYEVSGKNVYKEDNLDLITYGNGYYTITTWTEDSYGNRSVNQAYQAKMDLEPPTELDIKVAGESFGLGTGQNALTYEKFFTTAVDVSSSAKDDMEVIQKPECMLEASHGTLTGSSVEPNTRCQLHLTATDIAGNVSELYSKGFVVDSEAPTGINDAKLTIVPKGANRFGFYNKDVEVELAVNDSPCNESAAALQSVKYQLVHATGTKDYSLLEFNGVGGADSDLDAHLKFSETIKVNAKENEDNDTKLVLMAKDNGNLENQAEVVLPIDITAPTIHISFDNEAAMNERYYKNYRRAKIEIIEKNFSPDFVEFNIEKNGYSANEFVPSKDSWETDGDTHIAYIYFNKDGNYNFSVNCTDLADNKASEAKVELFTIDTTPAEIKVDYTEPVKKDGFVNKKVTANITVIEASFEPSLVKLETNNKITLGGWSHNGDTHKTTITFSEDGEYTYRLTCADLAGNQMDTMENEHFTIDTVLPEIMITGVEDESANAGEIAPVVVVSDANLDMANTKIRLTNGKGEEIALQMNPVITGNVWTAGLLNASAQPDSVYHLQVLGTDKAGNESELEYRYSLNRNGSTYDLSSSKAMIDKVYNRFADVTDIKIYEMNVDEIQHFNIYLTRNGETMQGRVSNSRPSGTDKNEVVYSVQKSGTEATGYTYTYTVFRENFKTEGLYNLTFTSEDKAGNHVNNTLAEKDAEVSFIVDDTAPAVYIDGVKTAGIYNQDEMKINVSVTDNFNLTEAVFTLVDAKGKEKETWNYKELATEDGDVLEITIPGSEEKQSLLYYVADAAGNVIDTKPGDKDTPTGFLISTSKEARLEAIEENSVAMAEKVVAKVAANQKSIPLAAEAGAAAGIVIAGGCVTVLLRKRKFGKKSTK